jgi:hypothetical protein
MRPELFTHFLTLILNRGVVKSAGAKTFPSAKLFSARCSELRRVAENSQSGQQSKECVYAINRRPETVSAGVG